MTVNLKNTHKAKINEEQKRNKNQETLGALSDDIDCEYQKPSVPDLNNEEKSINDNENEKISLSISEKLMTKYVETMGALPGDDENVATDYEYQKPSAPDLDNKEKSMNDHMNDHMNDENADISPSILSEKYYVGQKLMIKISKIVKVPATVIKADSIAKWIVVQYDLYYDDDGNNTDKLHIIDDNHRIEIRGNYIEESIKHEMDSNHNNSNLNDEEMKSYVDEMETSGTKSIEKK
eukprot:91764_1